MQQDPVRAVASTGHGQVEDTLQHGRNSHGDMNPVSLDQGQGLRRIEAALISRAARGRSGLARSWGCVKRRESPFKVVLKAGM